MKCKRSNLLTVTGLCNRLVATAQIISKKLPRCQIYWRLKGIFKQAVFHRIQFVTNEMRCDVYANTQ